MAGVVRRMSDGRRGDKGAMLEDAGRRLDGERHGHSVRDRGALQVREEGVLQKITLVGVSVRQRDAQVSCCSLCFSLSQPLLLGPAVLEPDLDLCFRELQVFCKFSSFSNGQVLLLTKLALQCDELRAREWGPGFAIFLLLLQTSWAQITTLIVT